MTTTFVFLGTYALFEGLNRFGQRIELSPEAAKETKHPRGLPAIPAEEFDALGFSPEELRKFGPAETHANAPAEFLEKKKRALELLHVIRGGE